MMNYTRKYSRVEAWQLTEDIASGKQPTPAGEVIEEAYEGFCLIRRGEWLLSVDWGEWIVIIGERVTVYTDKAFRQEFEV